MCAYVYVGQRSTWGVIPQVLCTLLSKVGFSLSQNSLSRQEWLTNESHGSPCICLDGTEITTMNHHIWLFYMCAAGDWTQVLILVCQHFSDRVISPALLVFRLIAMPPIFESHEEQEKYVIKSQCWLNTFEWGRITLDLPAGPRRRNEHHYPQP